MTRLISSDWKTALARELRSDPVPEEKVYLLNNQSFKKPSLHAWHDSSDWKTALARELRSDPAPEEKV